FAPNKEPSFETVRRKYQLGYVVGEIGEIACSLLPATGPELQRHSDIEAALNWLRESKQETPRILASEEMTCERLAEHPLVSFAPPEEWAKIAFGISFGAHPDEQKLVDAIDYCLPLLEEMLPAEFKPLNNSTTREST